MIIMKEMIYRNIYLIRKNILITFAIYVGLLFLGVAVALSARYGNLAKYGSLEIIDGANDAAVMLSILAGVALCTVSDFISAIIIKDYETGWHKYILASGVSVERYVAVNFIMCILMEIVSFAIGIMGVLAVRAISGQSDFVIVDNAGGNHDILMLIMGSLIFYMYIIYIILVSYLSKCSDSPKIQVIKLAPALLIPVMSVVLYIVLAIIEYDYTKIYKAVSKLSEHLWALALGTVLLSVAITFVCYLISVNSVRKEGRVL